MHSKFYAAGLVGSLVLLAAACASTPVGSPRVLTPGVAVAPAKAAPPAPRPPVVVTTAPMAGEPPSSALNDARLTASTCATQESVVAARIKKMRAEVDQSFKQWHDEQPACWAEDRRRDAERREEEACQSSGLCTVLADSISYGSEGVGYGRAGGRMAGSSRAYTPSMRAPQSAASMSSTNNQVAAVDESDIVKTDGRYVYIVANGALRIVEALKPRVVSVTKMPGDVREMTVEGDRAVVFVANGSGSEKCNYGYDCVVAGDGTSTTIHVFDITDRAAPKSIRTLDLTGSLIASRRIGTTVHAVVADGDSLTPDYASWPDDLGRCGTEERVVRAKVAKLKIDNERRIRNQSTLPKMHDNGVETPLCAGLLEAAAEGSHTFTTVVSFDMEDGAIPAKTATVRSRPGTVFVGEDALYISAWRPDMYRQNGLYAASQGEVSQLHKFHLGAHPSDTRYVGSGLIPGHVLNQFSMDEWHGYLRIATTQGSVPSPDVESAVSILAEGENGNLVRVGAAEHLARGEDIRAVRFDDDRGYVVTFKKTDPLFVLDLDDVAHPAVLGELKIPGFSTYLHRIDATHLLSIGFDANDHGDYAYFDGLLLQLFDVTDPTNPHLLHREKIGSRGSSSEAATDHLAFNYFPDRALLALPMSICEGGGDGTYGAERAFSGLAVYHVDVVDGFKPLGRIEHATAANNASGARACAMWWSQATSEVKRSLFLDDLVYSMAMDRVKVQRLGSFGHDVADISLRP